MPGRHHTDLCRVSGNYPECLETAHGALFTDRSNRSVSAVTLVNIFGHGPIALLLEGVPENMFPPECQPTTPARHLGGIYRALEAEEHCLSCYWLLRVRTWGSEPV